MNIFKALLNLSKIKGYVSGILAVITKANVVLSAVESQLTDYKEIESIKTVLDGINIVQLYLEKIAALLGIPKEAIGLDATNDVDALKAAIANLK